MSDEPTMKKCNHIECGGKLQPHSIDSATGELDCDGPCSPRRVQMWKDNVQATKETDNSREYDMCGRSVTLHRLKYTNGEHNGRGIIPCFDCGAPAKVAVIEQDGSAWVWCDMCQVGG